MAKTKRIGILTAGGDSPGLNAAIRGVGKAALGFHGMEIIGFRDGFRGLVENRRMRLEKNALTGILTVGGTILGTSRDKPHRVEIDGRMRDMTKVIIKNYEKLGLDALVCLGGGGTQKNALRLAEQGLRVLTLPKTIDNDVAMTDATVGFDTALGIATEAIDRLHSTAHSHHRIVVAEIMGHRAGWLALGAGIAGGADVILLPEIPYDVGKIAEAIRQRQQAWKQFQHRGGGRRGDEPGRRRTPFGLRSRRRRRPGAKSSGRRRTWNSTRSRPSMPATRCAWPGNWKS